MACRETYAGRWPTKAGEKLRLGVDFARHGAIRAGDSLTGTPTFTVVTGGSGVTVSAPSVSGTVASALFDETGGGVVPGEYEVRVTASTAGGQVVSRGATLTVES